MTPLNFNIYFEQLGDKILSLSKGAELYFVSPEMSVVYSGGKVKPISNFITLPIDITFPITFKSFEGAKLYIRTFDINNKIDHLNLLIENFNLKLQLKETENNGDIRAVKQQLQKAELRFKTIFDQFPLSIQILSPDGRTLKVNKSWKNLWEISEEVIQNYILKDYNILEDPVLEAHGLIDFIKRGFSGEIVNIPVINYDTQEAGLGGRSRLVEGLMFPLKDDEGKIRELVIIHTDVTDKETLLSQLTLKKNQFEAVIKSMPAGVMLVEKSSDHIILINQQMLEIQGLYESSRFLQKEKFPVGFYESIVKSLLNGEAVTNKEMKYTKESGKTIDISFSSAPIKNAEGEIAAAVAVVTDITDKKTIIRRQAFLDKLTSILTSTLDYDQLLTHISEACIPEIADACIIDLVENDQIKRLVTKHRRREVQNLIEKLQKYFPPTMESPQPGARVIRSGQAELLAEVNLSVVQAHTFDQNHTDLILSIGINSNISVPLLLGGKAIGSISFMNTTDRPPFTEADLSTAIKVAKRATLAIENARLYSEAKNAILKREEFISIASHELKTPITSMKLQLQLASRIIAKNSDGKMDSSYFKKVTDMSSKQLDRLTVLVDDMLDITRISSGKLAINLKQNNISAHLSDLLLNLCDELDFLSSLLSIEIQDDVLAHYDNFRIEQVLTNLLTNAIRYGEKKPIKVTLTCQNAQVCIRVTDNGPGIDPKDQERIFERFERAVSFNNISGLGLGLYISRQIMELHSGTLTLESSPGKGSSFIVQFPIK